MSFLVESSTEHFKKRDWGGLSNTVFEDGSIPFAKKELIREPRQGLKIFHASQGFQ